MNKQTAGGIEMSDKMREAFEKWLDQGNHCGCNENMWKAWQAARTVPVVGEAVALREFADEVKQLCKDFSDRHNRPYMGDVTAAIDGLLAQFVASQTSHVTQAELDALLNAARALDALLYRELHVLDKEVVFPFESHTQAWNHIIDARQIASEAAAIAKERQS